MTVNSVAMREAFGEALLALATDHPEMVVLDADVATSTTRTAPFGKAYPDRFFNMGVAEANMTDVAAGLATCGLRPIASTSARQSETLRHGHLEAWFWPGNYLKNKKFL